MIAKITDFLKDCFENSKINLFFFAGILLLLVWMPLEYGARYINTQVAGQVICGGLLLLLLREKNKILYRYPLWSISLFWIGILFLSFVYSIARLASLEELMRNIMYISLPIIIFSWATTNNRIKLLSFTILFTGTLVSLIGIFGFFSNYFATMTFQPAFSPLGRTNDLGAYLLFIFSLGLSNFLYEEESKIEKAIYGLVTILSFLTIIMTFSRGIWLSGIIAVILILILGRKILKKNLIYIGIVFVLSLIPFIFYWENIIDRFLSLQNIFSNAENSLEWRKSLLRASVEMFLDHPVIGVGLNSFPFIFYIYQERAGFFSINPHNYYLQLLTETGVVGFIAFVVLALSILFMSYKAFQNSEKIVKGIALGLLTGIITSLFHISLDIDWSVLSIPTMFWIEVGLLISIYHAVGFKETRFTEFSDRFNYLKKPILVIIATSVIIIPTTNFISLSFYSKSARALEENEIEKAEKYSYWAMKFSPWPSGKHHSNYSIILSKQKRFPEALNMIIKAIELDKYNHNYYKTYSDTILNINPKEKEKALDALITAVVLNPYTHPSLYENIGDFYNDKMGKINEAIAWYKRGIKNFPLVYISSYETYTPGDRFELYSIYKKLAKLTAQTSPISSKEYRYIAEYLLRSQPAIDSELGTETSTPTSTITSYWSDVKIKSKYLERFVLENYQIFHPPSNFSYKFIEFIKINHNIFSVNIEYSVLMTNKDTRKVVFIIDTLVPSKNGWLISSRIVKGFQNEQKAVNK